MVHRELRIAVRKVLDLLLLRDNLLVEQVDLLGGNGIVVILGLLAGRRGFSADVVQRFLAVGAELGVFEFPGLCDGISRVEN